MSAVLEISTATHVAIVRDAYETGRLDGIRSANTANAKFNDALEAAHAAELAKLREELHAAEFSEGFREGELLGVKHTVAGVLADLRRWNAGRIGGHAIPSALLNLLMEAAK